MRRALGFSLTELLIVLAILASVAAMGIPMLLTGLRDQRVNASARDVQSELQSARLLAVSSNRPMRVRFNCPDARQFRRVELIGTPSAPDARDSATNRCDPEIYRVIPPDRNVLTRPNFDGAVRWLADGVTFSAAQSIEFWPDGTAHVQSTKNPWPPIGAAGVTINVASAAKTKSITVNAVGKVSLK